MVEESPSNSRDLGPASRAASHWAHAAPDELLTWGRPISGDAFIGAVRSCFSFTPRTVIAEVGPGYGRLFRSILDASLPFGGYVGVDVSPDVCETLARRFPDPRAQFLNANAATVRLPAPFDLLLSSLTLKHFYPTFESALANLVPQGATGARFVFDLIEVAPREVAFDAVRPWIRLVSGATHEAPGASPSRADGVMGEGTMLVDLLRTGSYGQFERNGVTYVRKYTRRAVRGILDRRGLDLVSFDVVQHDARHRRLLVVADRRAEKQTYASSS